MKRERLATGASAEIFAWGDDAVLKLFLAEYQYAVDMEAERARAVVATGLPAPAVRDVVREGERRGIVFERVHGPTLLEQIGAGALSLEDAGVQLADLHVRVHAVRGVAGLPRRKQIMGEVRARIPESERADFEARMAGVPEGDAVYHGDFHPGNVIVSPDGPVVVDWPNAALAHPSFDVARSIVLMRYQTAPGVVEPGERRVARARLTDAYLARYLELGLDVGGVTREQVEAGLPAHAHGILRANAFSDADRAVLEAWATAPLRAGVTSSG